jgi:4-amino-4-deoxy-L-arabinose transferase-like glycosyltransferase
MCQQSLSSKLRKKELGKWRLLLAVFIVAYTLLLLLDLTHTPLQWDEANNLIGGLLLRRGYFERYLETNMFYPPLADLAIAGYFTVTGVSVFSGRLLGVTFASLSVWVTFELANKLYGAKTALIASIILGTMPGFVWLARLTMLETMLVFFFSTTMLLFLMWLLKHENKYLLLSGITLGLGFLTKYQTIIALIAMVGSIVFLCCGYIKEKLSRFPLLIVIAILIVLPWVIVCYQAYSSGILNQWLYALQIGNPQKSMYSMRFPAPIFYLIEMVWPYGTFHPISILVYVLGLLGLGLLLMRRKPEDKYLLTFFFVIFIFFSLIGNKEWRYIVPVFPIIAISAASLITFSYDRIKKVWERPQAGLNKKLIGKVAAGCLIAIVALAVSYSCVDASQWIGKHNVFNVPVGEATNYVAKRIEPNESLVVLCGLNVFSQDIVKFYLQATEARQWRTVQYPALAVDAYTPSFNINELRELCSTRNVKYLLLFEYGEIYPYFNSTLTMQEVYDIMLDSKCFICETIFGEYPCSIYILSCVEHNQMQ